MVSRAFELRGSDDSFEEWRAFARIQLAAGVPPSEIIWNELKQPSLFDDVAAPFSAPGGNGSTTRVPKEFLEHARVVAYHRSARKWDALYRVLFRLVYEKHRLLDDPTDRDVLVMLKMKKEVTRDAHKMKAFVRFKELTVDGRLEYVAWFQPAQLIVPYVAPFFASRFANMRWLIMTPDQSVRYDGSQLTFGEGVPVRPGIEDAVESLWRTYYSAIFNPARVKMNAMRKEMPVRYWSDLPESRLISPLARKALQKAAEMTFSPEAHLPPDEPAPESMHELKSRLRRCSRCSLYKCATQAVFGEGKREGVELMLIGEQPGDFEDRSGRPFVGPAGEVLDRALEAAGIDRAQSYLTNAVKHFKFVERGKARIHQKPKGFEINACRIWLDAEIQLIKPTLLVCLGATAAQSVFGRAVKVLEERGRILPAPGHPSTLITVHPSYILRAHASEAEKEAIFEGFVSDLKKARAYLLSKEEGRAFGFE